MTPEATPEARSKSANSHYELGVTLLQQGSLDQAAASFSKALSIRPGFHQAIDALGVVLQQAGRLEQSVVCYRKAISIAPGYVSAHNNLGLALHALGRWDEAVASFQDAIQYEPTFAAVYANMANSHITGGDFESAVRACDRAIELQPNLVEAHIFSGNAFRAQGLLTRAAGCYEKAISLAPASAAILSNLGEIFKDQNKLQQAIDAYQKALDVEPGYAIAYSNLLYLHAFTRDIPPSEGRLLAEGWERAVLTEAERAAAREAAIPASGVFAPRPLTGRKLRLGIVSADLGDHPVSEFLEPFLKHLDRSRFHLTLFPTHLRTGPRAERLHGLADKLVSLHNVADQQAAERIRSEQVDVLMDTSGHTSGGRMGIFARRAAPVQCTHIGYWSTTGLTEMDWFITDLNCPPSIDADFTEGLWRLPRLAYCYHGDPSLPIDGWMPDPDGTLWLGSFNKYGKIREQTLALWAAVLNAVPEARLLFEDRQINEEENHQRILATLAAHDIGADRTAFIPFEPGHQRHMRLYDRLDIALDTIPFNSGTTAYDALWMGLPLVTLEASCFCGTLSAGALRAFGREDWIARDTKEYVSTVRSIARGLKARDAGSRIELREKQRARMAASPLCDAEEFTRSLEAAFEAMYNRWIGTE